MAKTFLTGLSTKLFEWLLKFKGVKTSPDTLAHLEDEFFTEDLPNPFPAIEAEYVITGSLATFKVIRVEKTPPMVVILDSVSEIEYKVDLDLFDNVFTLTKTNPPPTLSDQ